MFNIYNNFGQEKQPNSIQGLLDYIRESKNIYSEHKKLKLYSFAAGLAVIAFLAARLLLGVFLKLSQTLYNLILVNEIFNFSLLAVFSAIAIGLPFFVVYKLTGSLSDRDMLPLGKPKSFIDMILLIIAGFAACIGAGIISSYFILYVQELFNVKFLYSIDPPPKTAIGLFFYILAFAVMPALLEEFALRGVVMQPLRKYGDTFAILMSAIVFALMHGNMVQAPFALLAGAAIGFAVIKTENLWTGIIIHFLNNASSVLQSVLIDRVSNTAITGLIIYLAYAIIIILGILSLFVFFKREKRRNEKNMPYSYNPFVKKQPILYENPYFPLKRTSKKYIFTAPMLTAILIMVFQTISTISYNL